MIVYRTRPLLMVAWWALAAGGAQADALDPVSFAPYAPHASAREFYDQGNDFRHLWIDIKQETFDMSAALIELATALNVIGGGAPYYNEVIVNISANDLSGSGPSLYLQTIPRRADGRALDAADVLRFSKFGGVSANAVGELMSWCDNIGWHMSEYSDEWCAASLPRFCRSEHRDGRCPIMAE